MVHTVQQVTSEDIVLAPLPPPVINLEMGSSDDETPATVPAEEPTAEEEKPKEGAPKEAGAEGEEEATKLPCSVCGEECWQTGWFLPAETEGSTERKSLCDDCFLVRPDIKGADRCLRGQLKVLPPKKPKKPKVAKKRGAKAKH
ncbi:expressed unknown protein [Seminavis robusta]|uniref:Uncharacterized protein n=1 Tax=Seminavis robusta TaxID=568900 RepID=A0A9N8F374_9STRA|nr:expressed unknown protein [Seminavis robusta]|eukprot:Sro2570_g331530.1 n/a (144) ;mRNA; f:1843-2274